MASDVSLVSSEPLASGLPGAPDDSLALDRLRAFRILPQKWLRWLLALLPVAICLWFIGGLLALPAGVQPDYFLLTAFLFVVIDLVLLRLLFDGAPEVLLRLWTRRLLLAHQSGAPMEEAIQAFLRRFERALNHPMMHALGALIGLISISFTYFVLTALLSGQNPFSAWILERLVTGLRILYLPLGYFVGVMTWKVLVIAYFLYKLGDTFHLRIQTNHPDRCGGLKPLGDLTLIIALLLLVPGIYLAVWGFISVMNPSTTLAVYETWSAPFRLSLFALIVTAFFAFFLPVYSIHRQMTARRKEILSELDRLSQVMDDLLMQVRAEAAALNPQQGAEKLDSLKFMQKVYTENERIPTWPFELGTMLRFAGAQALPLLSLISTSGPVVDTIKNLLVSLVK